MSKTQIIVSLFLAFLISLTTNLSSYSDGPPPGRTGAPGELTCYNGYCHNSFPLNSGPGTTSIKSDIPPEGYEPNKIYNIEVKIAQQGMKRFGFELLPFSPISESVLGKIILSNPENTKLEEDKGKIYIMHDTAQANLDSVSWEFQWKSPEKGAGEVIFHWAVVAANYNGYSSGDYVYKANQEIAENLTASIWDEKPKEELVRIIRSESQLKIQSIEPSTHPTKIEVIDIQGRRVFTWNGTLDELDIPTNHWNRGIYVFLFQNGRNSWSKKMVW